MYTIHKEFHFSASHQLHGLREGHQCGRLHGHNYVVEVELAGETLTDVGFIRDYEELDDVKRFIDREWDHRHPNEWFAKNRGHNVNPSAEQMAWTVFDRFQSEYPEMVAVRVRETEKTCAEYRP